MEDLIKSSYDIETSIEETTGQDAEEKGTIYLFSYQGQRNGDNGRCQRPRGILYGHVFDTDGIAQPYKEQHYSQQRDDREMPGIARLYSLYKLSYLHFHVSQAVRRHCYASVP